MWTKQLLSLIHAKYYYLCGNKNSYRSFAGVFASGLRYNREDLERSAFNNRYFFP